MNLQKTFKNISYKLGSSNDSDIATASLAAFKLFFIPVATMSDKKATKEQKEYAATRDFLTELIALGTYVGVTREFKRHGTTPLCLSYYKKKAKLIRDGKIPGVDPKLFTEEDFKAIENIDKKSFKSVMIDINHRSPEKRIATAEEKKYVDGLTNVVKKFKKAFPPDPVKPEGRIAKIKYNWKNLFNKNLSIQLPKDLYKNVKLNISQMVIWTLAVIVIPPMCNALIKPAMKKFQQMQEKRNPKFNAPVKLDPYPSHNTQMYEKNKTGNNVFGTIYGKTYNNGNMRVGI
ncbi:MAG TPA: hypothetical protein PKI94_07060 [Candidatus Gastranaerophilaceae bacterium]|nr:hypothetical protein [Candidatus Gastranaerophilaceae bacterium]